MLGTSFQFYFVIKYSIMEIRGETSLDTKNGVLGRELTATSRDRAGSWRQKHGSKTKSGCPSFEVFLFETWMELQQAPRDQGSGY
jgi:hypothetical protein